MRYVFFSFDYDRDIWRVSVVRNHWVTKGNSEIAGYVDKAEWEAVKKNTSDVIKKWIDKQLEDTSVTVVLIGAKTSYSQYVQYEIEKSMERGNGFLGIYINNIKNSDGETDSKGSNPLDNFKENRGGKQTLLSKIYPPYDWVNDNGYDNFPKWVEAAAKKVGR
ncbi:TIR-like domain protein [Candidatus Magnetobacterium bavaricum]|uniref:TIR-like domain protein n=1 Tax=Candidatus Magnetobacterium bavaricum TaxID=29290 RepID=A0A0F3GUE9_9BACT|nr:TIR-like domain protein [Candidatus Magnetobacterium bavaricum]